MKICLKMNYDYVIKTKLEEIKYKIDRVNDCLYAQKLDEISNELKKVINYYDELKKDLEKSENNNE